MAYFPQVKTQLEISQSTQLSSVPGHFLELIIHISAPAPAAGQKAVWRVWDNMGTSGDVIPQQGKIVWAAQWDNPRAQEGQVITLDWPCETAIYLEVPPGGVCAAKWI
jgi:hypothetical protein